MFCLSILASFAFAGGQNVGGNLLNPNLESNLSEAIRTNECVKHFKIFTEDLVTSNASWAHDSE